MNGLENSVRFPATGNFSNTLSEICKKGNQGLLELLETQVDEAFEGEKTLPESGGGGRNKTVVSDDAHAGNDHGGAADTSIAFVSDVKDWRSQKLWQKGRNK